MKKLSSISSKASNKDSIFIPPQPPKSLFEEFLQLNQTNL